MDKKLLAIILGVLVGSIITSPTFSFAQKETDSDKPEADCDAYENDKNKLSEENKKVIVIGAGISGLATAHHLHCKGYDVEVFEACDRIGGRIFTDNSSGVALDRGASWIHGIEKSPVYELAVNNGMNIGDDLIKTDQSSYVVYNSEGQEITPLCVKTESKDELIKRLNTTSNALVYPHEFPFDELDEVFPQK